MARLAAARRRLIKHISAVLKGTTANNSRIDIGTDVYLWERTQPCSYAFWIFPFAYPSGSSGHIFSEYGATAPFRGRMIRIDSAGSGLKLWLINTFGSNELQANFPPPPIGRWTRVVITYDGSSTAAGIKCYYNNESQPRISSIATLSATIVPSGVATRWGQWGGATGLGMPMFLGKPAILNYEMSAAQVADDWYDQRFSGATPIDVYELNEGSGTSVASTGSGAHNGTVGAGMTWETTNTPMRTRSPLTQNRLSVS